MPEIDGIRIEWLGHDTFKLEKDGYVVYFDPYQLPEGSEKADVILITHEHYDHFSMEDIKKIISPKTYIVASNSCQGPIGKIEDHIKVAIFMIPDEVTDAGDVNIHSVHAYNLNKFREKGVPFHGKDEQKLGYIIRFGGKRIYHMGDTDNIPELASIKDVDLALVPVSGTYVMTAEEAAQAVQVFKPRKAIPMHYGSIVGSEKDAERFKGLAKGIEVLILHKTK